MPETFRWCQARSRAIDPLVTGAAGASGL
jgi:hypothetical protein